MEAVQFIQTTPQELKAEIVEGVKAEVARLFQEMPTKEPSQYLTRQEVADMFRINLSTLHAWTKGGKFKTYGIGGRIYYRKSEIDNAVIPLT